eukprot:3699261-Amphidinium_carterae.2
MTNVVGWVALVSMPPCCQRLDYNNNGIVSLAEVDKMVVELVSGGSWPAWCALSFGELCPHS